MNLDENGFPIFDDDYENPVINSSVEYIYNREKSGYNVLAKENKKVDVKTNNKPKLQSLF